MIKPPCVLILVSFVILLSSCTGVRNSGTSKKTQLEDRKPYPIGGLETIYRNVRYPEAGRRSGAEGKIVIDFTVDTNGRTRNITVVQGIHEACDREAVRIVRQSKWEPGIQDGQYVAVQFQLPITFRLSLFNL